VYENNGNTKREVTDQTLCERAHKYKQTI